jgi:hypothetical protein
MNGDGDILDDIFFKINIEKFILKNIKYMSLKKTTNELERFS